MGFETGAGWPARQEVALNTLHEIETETSGLASIGVTRKGPLPREVGPRDNGHSADDCQINASIAKKESERGREASTPIPYYLEQYYWWAYVHPNAVRVFERGWLINAILWGNYTRLRDAAIDALGAEIPGRTLQVASAYGDFSLALAERVAASGGALDIIDALPIQIENLRAKLGPDSPVNAAIMDSASLGFEEGAFDRVSLFFLLHEQPLEWRRRTLAEALRVVRPGGEIVVVEYARPKWWNPLRYLLRPIIGALEPFALDLWGSEIEAFMPPAPIFRVIQRASYFGGLYQIVQFKRVG
jgi:ubiquinone/menaquinone biosynthesis C-methylase UbiE